MGRVLQGQNSPVKYDSNRKLLLNTYLKQFGFVILSRQEWIVAKVLNKIDCPGWLFHYPHEK